MLGASVAVMPVLARAKRRVGLGLYALTGAAWLDPVAGFVIAIFAVHEGREAWQGELVEGDDDEDDEDD